MDDALYKAVLAIGMDAFVPEAVFPQLVRRDVAAAGQGGQGADVSRVQGRNVLPGYGLRLLSSPVPPRRGPSGGGGSVGLARQGKPLSTPAGRLQKRACSRQSRRTGARPVQVSRSRRTELPGGDTQGRADARSEAPAPALRSPQRVAAFGDKRLGRGSLRLRLYCLGALRGLPRGTDRRDGGAQMQGVGFAFLICKA